MKNDSVTQALENYFKLDSSDTPPISNSFVIYFVAKVPKSVRIDSEGVRSLIFSKAMLSLLLL